ncbi:TraX family protein [Vallitalea sediminicola]
MNSTNLKIIACLTMLVDHLGAIFFPQYIYLRIIGRIAFPIFAFLIAEGYFHTHDVKKYLIRLFTFALISEIPYNLAFEGNIIEFGSGLNVFFTLFFGLLAVFVYDHYKKLGYLLVLLIGIVAYFLDTDYGILGVLVIFAFYVFRSDFYKQALSYILLTSLFLGIMYFRYHGINLQVFSPIALIFIYYYNGKKGPKIKYLFYVFYPGHLLILGLLEYIL